MDKWLAEHDLIFKMIWGIYAFTSLSYGWAWVLYCRLMGRVEKLETNHLAHVNQELSEIRKFIGMPDPQE